MSSNLDSILVGVAGEYLVAAELSQRGIVAAISLRNSRGIDIIASNADGTKSVSIQVKTNSKGNREWMLSKDAENMHSSSHYYVFVSLADIGKRADFHVVPSTVVADYVARGHQNWLSEPKRDGTPKKDSSMRKFKDPHGQYLESWDLIDLQ